jgi:hypothetical protein
LHSVQYKKKIKIDRLYTILQKNGGTDTKPMGKTEPQFLSVSGLATFLISVENMNLLSSSIYKHLKTYLIKHKRGSQLISVLSNIFQF